MRPSDLSSSDECATPPELFAALAAMYGRFHLDAAANATNSKCGEWYSATRDALAQPWGAEHGPTATRVWCNPPYSRGKLKFWTAKARAEVLSGRVALVTLLVPHYTAEGWWQNNVEAPEGEVLSASHAPSVLGPRTQVRYGRLTVETLRIRGRVHFIEASGATGSAPFSSVAVTMARPDVLPPLSVPRKRGPRTCVTPEIEAAIRAAVDAGDSIVRACELGGIARKTWYRHLERRALERSARG